MDHGHTVRVVWFLLLAGSCTLGSWASGAEPTTEPIPRWDPDWRRPPVILDPAKLDQIKDGMTLGEIADVLGPACSMSVGCGILLWAFSDGRQLEVWPREYKESEVITKQGPGGSMRVEQGRALPDRKWGLDLGNGAIVILVCIPPGKFLMGCPDPKEDGYSDQVPHEVLLTQAFYMAATPVTVDQFAAFAKDTGYETEGEKAGSSLGFEIKVTPAGPSLEPKTVAACSWRSPGFEQKGSHPVVEVSWNDAQAFCAWLSKKSGWTVALPTEAQWEYACRAGTKTIYPWGDNPDGGRGWANCGDRSFKKKLGGTFAMAGFGWDDGFVFTSPVGSFNRNAFGLYDMIGNVKQWCQDWYGPYGKGAVTDPTGPVTGRGRVIRGASWLSIPWNCGSAARHMDAAENRDCDVGFRIVVTASGEN